MAILDGDYTQEDVIDYQVERVEPQAGIHGNFAHVVTSKVLLSSYVQGDPTSVTKSYDFSATVDGVTSANVTLAANIDSILSQNNNLRGYAGSATSTHYITFPGLDEFTVYDVTFSVYQPSTNTNAKTLFFAYKTPAGSNASTELSGFGSGFTEIKIGRAHV
jgi:hypothetical protein